MIFDAADNEEVIPQERPTVPIAEHTSYKTSSDLKELPSMANIAQEKSSIAETTININESALLMVSFETLRLNMVTLLFEVITLLKRQNITASVVVLKPPPVPAGEAPIIIRSIHTSFEAGVISPCEKEAKPAVLVVTD